MFQKCYSDAIFRRKLRGILELAVKKVSVSVSGKRVRELSVGKKVDSSKFLL